MDRTQNVQLKTNIQKKGYAMDVKMLTGDAGDRKRTEEIVPLESSEISYHKNILNSILKGNIDAALPEDISKINTDIESLTKSIEELQSRPRRVSYPVSYDSEDDEDEDDEYDDSDDDDDTGYSCSNSSYSAGYRNREIEDHRPAERRIPDSSPERLRITANGSIIKR